MTTSNRGNSESRDPQQQILQKIETLRLGLVRDCLGIESGDTAKSRVVSSKSGLFIHLIREQAEKNDAKDDCMSEEDAAFINPDLGPSINHYSSAITAYADRLEPEKLGSAREAFKKTVDRINSESLAQLEETIDLLEKAGASEIKVDGKGAEYFRAWLAERKKDGFGFDPDGALFGSALADLKPRTGNEDMEWAKLSDLFDAVKQIMCTSISWNILCFSARAYAAAGEHDEAVLSLEELTASYAEIESLELLRQPPENGSSGGGGIMMAS
jgi:hypothetical protein